jgi:Ca2+-binding RTX toxin-like protein
VDVIDGSVEFTDGALTITEGELGSARFSYAVNDEAGAESIQWVDVNFFADDAAPGSTGSVGGQFLFGSQRTSFWFLPANTFSHANGDSLQVAATLEDGSPLPDWLEFIDVYNADAAQDANGTILPRNFFGTDARWVFSAIIPQGAEALDPASFNVRVTATDTDGDTASVTQTVTVFGNRGLRAELAADDRFYTQVNEPLVITDTDLFNNDVGGGVFSFGAFVSNEANGRAESVTDQLEERFRYVEFTPDQDFIGTASFDLDLFGYESTVFVEVLGPNRPPVVLVEDATVRAGQETVLPLRDDVTSDPDGDSVSLQFALSDGSALPSWLVFDTENMAFVANPPLFSAPGTDGVDGDQEVESLEITATAADTEGLLATDTFVLTVLPAENLAPIANADGADAQVGVSLSIATSDLLLNDLDPEGEPLEVVAVVGSSDAAVTLNEGVVEYQSDDSYRTTDVFYYTVSDAAGATSTAPVTVTISNTADKRDDSLVTLTEEQFDNTIEMTASVEELTTQTGASVDLSGIVRTNEPPVANDDTTQAEEDTVRRIPVSLLLANDSDANDDTLQVVSVGDAENGTVELVSDEILFTPDADYYGPAVFSYTIIDSEGERSSASVSIDVQPVNDAPVASDDVLQGMEDEVLRVSVADLLVNDTDIDDSTLLVVSVTDAENGAVELVGEEVLFTPKANYHGPASFSYVISDPSGTESSASVSIDVQPVNDPPVANDDAFDGVEDEVTRLTVGQLLSNDLDIDGDELRVVAVAGSENGAVELIGDEVFFTPSENYNGEARFSYTVEDAGQSRSSATVDLNIAAVNDAPSAIDDTFNGEEDVPVEIEVADMLANDSDPDGDLLVVTGVGDAENGTVELIDSRVLFTPDPGFNGLAGFSYTIADVAEAQTSAFVSLNIAPDEVDPIAIDPLDDLSVEDCKPFHINLPVTVSGADGADLLYTLQTDSGEPLPEWLSFDSNTLQVSGTPPIGQKSTLKLILTAASHGATAQTDLTVHIDGAEIDGLVRVGNWYSNRMFGSARSDSLAGGYGNDLIKGKDGDDLLNGGYGHDVLLGGKGNDRIIGGSGSDTIYGQWGDDKVDAGSHNDKYYDWYGDNCAHGGSGHDVLKTGNGRDHLYGGTGNDLIYGGGGNDQLFGDDGSDRIFGQYGDDTLHGGDGNDLLKDYDGHNILFGGSGRDYVFSGKGNDTVAGGAGNDVISAGYGDDIYQYAKGDGKDFIFDYGGHDTLQITGVSRDDVSFKRKNNDLFVDPEGDGFLRIQNWFKHHGRIELIEFDSGEVVNSDDIYRLVDSISRFDAVGAASDSLSIREADDDSATVLIAA